MSDLPHNSGPAPTEPRRPARCPACDTVTPTGAEQCSICGARLPASLLPEEPAEVTGQGTPASAAGTALPAPEEPETQGAAQPATPEDAVVAVEPFAGEQEEERPVFETLLREREAPVTFALTAVFTLFILVAGFLILQNPVQATVALFPTPSPIPPPATLTPTWTPYPTETSPPTETPTITVTSLPTDTPRPPRSHNVAANETLFGLSLLYNITAGSIADVNDLGAEGQIQVGQSLIIPWPTATPPLVAVAVELGGETVIADPADCRLYEIERGDNLFAIAARNRIPLEALQHVNRLTDDSIIRPGDTLCMPNIIRGGVLPPTPGPSPTPTVTLPPPGPSLLYPVRHALVGAAAGPVALQWVAVKDLAPDEWYMVEVTNLTQVDSHPMRAFTRQSSFVLPEAWRTPSPEEQVFRWRVSIVRVTGERSDGSFIYTFGGNPSQDGFFTWVGR
jgi:LysM repeat protein